ncbi:DUF6318 family protein [Kocuria flava]|uniref:DUF6318 family protein n=1 Tax=Kocuria flava TaxID=446860 RepID=UPI0015DF2EEA|nr:DUF6318 family protein [Kocuria flava]
MVRSWSVGAPAGVALLAALLLTGCAPGEPGNDDAAAPPGPGSSSPAPTSSSEEGSAATADEYVPASLEGPARNVPEPVLPALAKEESLEGAQAFLDYWSDAKWYAYETGDSSLVRKITSPHCRACEEEFSDIENVHKKGMWTLGGRDSLDIQDENLQRAIDGVYKPRAIYARDNGQLIRDSQVERAFPALRR